MHGLFLGMTESGKSSCAVELARAVKLRGYCVIVLDPFLDPNWKKVSDFITDDESRFLKTVRSSRQCFVFVDEAGETCGNHTISKGMKWLATQSRHSPYGHSCFFIAQRATMIDRTVRNQTRVLYLFETGPDDCRILAQEWNRQEIRDSGPDLAKGEYLYIRRNEKVDKRRLY